MAFLVLFRQERGLSLSDIALVTGIYSLTILLLEIPSGALSDWLGPKKTTLAAYIFIFLTGIINFFSFSFALFTLAGIVYGIGRALISGALESWFINTLKKEDPNIDMLPYFSKANSMELFALATGTGAGGIIAGYLYSLGSLNGDLLSPYSIVILLSSLMHAVNFILVVGLVKTELKPQQHNKKSLFEGIILPALRITFQAVNRSFQNRILFSLLLAGMVNGLVIMGLETYWQPFFAGLPKINSEKALSFSFLMAGSFAAGILGNSLSGRVLKLLRGKNLSLIVLSVFLRGTVLLMLALQSSVYVAAVFFLLAYFFSTLASPSLSVIINNEIPGELRATMLSVQSLFFFGGCLAGSLISSWICRILPLSAYWLFLSAAVFLSLLIYIPVKRELGRI